MENSTFFRFYFASASVFKATYLGQSRALKDPSTTNAKY